MTKPPLPADILDGIPRIPVDMSKGTDAHEIEQLANTAAVHWVLGPDGPYKRLGQTLNDIVSNAIREGLTHLLELGLIDIDSQRMHSALGWPVRRDQFLPTAPAPDSTNRAEAEHTAEGS